MKRLLALSLVAVLTTGTSSGATSVDNPGGSGGPTGGPVLEPVPPASYVGRFRSWTTSPTGIPGQIAYGEHEVVLTDHPFDDHGADLDNSGGRSIQPAEQQTFLTGSLLAGLNSATGAAGDYVYPDDPALVGNSADIVEVRVAIDQQNLYLLVTLNSLVDAARTALDVRIDDDQLVVHGEHAAFRGESIDVAFDLAENVVELRLPRPLLDPGTAVRRFFVASGVWDPEHDDWLRPDTLGNAAPYFDLAYVPGEDFDSYWHDAKQASDIREGTFVDDRFSVDLERLLEGYCESSPCTDLFAQVVYTRVFRSGQTLVEGVSARRTEGVPSPLQAKTYGSRHQPYAIYEPLADPVTPRPLVLLLHPAGGNHMTYVLTGWPGFKGWADEIGAIVAMPLGRGEAGWFHEEAEKDVFEVWRDLAQHHKIDPERVYLAGVGMGGFGVWKLGHLYPDLFAKAIVWAAPTSEPADDFETGSLGIPCEPVVQTCSPSIETLFGNARNLPYLVVHGALDPLTPVTGPEEWMERYEASGSPFRYVVYPTRGYESTFPATTLVQTSSWLADATPRVRDPFRVSHCVVKGLSSDQVQAAGRAYWLSELDLTPEAQAGCIDVTRSAEPLPPAESSTQVGLDSAGLYREVILDPPAGVPAQGFLTLQSHRLSRAAIDVTRIGWNTAAPNRIHASTSGPLELRLNGDFPPDLAVTGATYVLQGGALVLFLEPGDSDVLLEVSAGEGT